MDPFIQLSGATVVLGDTRALDNLTLTIPVGEHTAILGPNGAGKSSLIKLLTLQQYPLRDIGSPPPILVFGRDRWDVSALRTQMGIVSADLHDKFVIGHSSGIVTALEAVLSGFLATHGIFAHHTVTEVMRRRAADALARVGAAHLSDTMLNTMSTGEVRRVLIARALVHEPRTLLLDEPTRGLDLVARHDFMERVRAIARDGTTTLIVTHHVEEIVPEIGRVILLSRGKVAYDGPKAEALRPEQLSPVFGAPLAVDLVDGYYHVRVTS